MDSRYLRSFGIVLVLMITATLLETTTVVSSCDECYTNSVCTNTSGTLECGCKDGFDGNGTFCADINKCDNTTACSFDNIDECFYTSACHDNATCNNTEGSYSCACNKGYTGNGTVCTELWEVVEILRSFADECGNENDCHANANCTNTEGSYHCACNAGYDGNATECTDNDECAIENDCHANASCTNTEGSYYCACNDGYDGNGTECTDINKCDNTTACSFDNIDECFYTAACHGNATCTNTIGSYSCSCDAGYTGNGTVCTDINECFYASTCHDNATCTDTEGSYVCSCNEGYTGNGTVCTGMTEE